MSMLLGSGGSRLDSGHQIGHTERYIRFIDSGAGLRGYDPSIPDILHDSGTLQRLDESQLNIRLAVKRPCKEHTAPAYSLPDWETRQWVTPR